MTPFNIYIDNHGYNAFNLANLRHTFISNSMLILGQIVFANILKVRLKARINKLSISRNY